MGRTKAAARIWRPGGRPLPNPAPPLTTSSSSRVLRSHTTALAATPSVRVTKPRRKRLDPWTPKRKVNPNPKPRTPPPTHYTCRICIEEQTTEHFPRWVPSKRGRSKTPWDVPFGCIAHLARSRKVDPVCKTCIGRTMSARLDNLGPRAVMGCVEPACDSGWPWEYVMKYMPSGAPLEKYNMEMFEVWRQDADPKPITCGSLGCTAIGVPDATAAGYPQVSCTDCSYRFCAQCCIPWHQNLTCAEHAAKHIHEKMTDPEKDTLMLMQTKDGKRCPNCYLVIEKDGGCDSMLCLGCNKYFNWTTAASAIPGSNKAQTVVHENPYWHYHSGPVVCEMDARAAEDNGSALLVAAVA